MMNGQGRYMKTTFGYLAVFVLVLCTSAGCQDSKDDSGYPLPIYDEGCQSLMKALHQEWSKARWRTCFCYCKKNDLVVASKS